MYLVCNTIIVEEVDDITEENAVYCEGVCVAMGP